MSISDVIKMALRNLWKRKLRTFLTILGVIIGTASIVVMVSIGIGMNESFQKQVEEWGSLQVINVYAAGSDRYYEEEEVQKDKKATEITTSTIEEFKKIPYVEAATPVMNEYICFVAGKYLTDASVQGIDPASMEAMGFCLCVTGAVCLILFGVLTVMHPSTVDRISGSSAVALNGTGMLILLFVLLMVSGMRMMFKKK